MRYLIATMLVIVGLIHLLPVSGVLGSERLTALYGLSFDESNLVILMRHRAVMLGLLGLLFIFAAFKPMYQPIAFVAAFVSVLSFLWLVWSTGSYNASVGRVFTADVIALVCLVVGICAYAFAHRQR